MEKRVGDDARRHDQRKAAGIERGDLAIQPCRKARQWPAAGAHLRCPHDG